MNFFPLESLLSRQRCRQWTPLITQQLRLRHVCQIICFNLPSECPASYYFTLHLTTMCAPFYTSERLDSPHPKWNELDMKKLPNTATTSLVIRIWRVSGTENDDIVITWGVNLSGLVYLGNKLAYVQPTYFKTATLIFYMLGGYFASHTTIRTDLPKPVPFIDSLNLLDTGNDRKLLKRFALEAPNSEIRKSYSLEKLRKLHFLQVTIKKRSVDVDDVVNKINALNSPNENERTNRQESKVRYSPSLLTMNSLNKMLHEKPTKLEKQQMVRTMKMIEVYKYKAKLLSQERDKKSAGIRLLKNKLAFLAEENEDRNSNLMENYHTLHRDIEKLREIKGVLLHNTEVLSYMNSQLQHRRRQLLQELLFIYPIDKITDNKYNIYGIYLPHSDVLPDSPNTGVSVALGYVTHVLTMCSTFLQVPLRYPMTHYGSRSYITDLIPDRERELPLFTKGKDKIHFNCAVYLLNKNIAQLRWLYYMNTDNLKATLPNLLQLLQGGKDDKPPLAPAANYKLLPATKLQLSRKQSNDDLLKVSCTEKFVSLSSYGSTPNISDPILDLIKHENKQRSISPNRQKKLCSRSSECGPGLSEILAIPEAYLNKQISSSSFKNYMASEMYKNIAKHSVCCAEESPNSNSTEYYGNNCDNNLSSNTECIEQGTDPLDSLQSVNKQSNVIDIKCPPGIRNKVTHDLCANDERRISRSVGSYTDDESHVSLKINFEMGSDPLLAASNSKQDEAKGEPNLLTVRTDALLRTKSFNLVKPRQ